LLQEGDGDGYGTFGTPSSSGGTRRRTWLGGSSTGGGTGRESRADRIKRRLEVTASVVGLRKAVSYDDVSVSFESHPRRREGREEEGGRDVC